MRKNFTLRSLLCLALASAMLLPLAGCGKKHEHTWQDATCTEPKTCTECGETEGEPLGHDWEAATCEEPRTCQVCGRTRGKKLDHRWSDASCTEPAVCELCGETDGEAPGHEWLDASCTEPETCEVCGETNGDPLGHDWIPANYQEAQRCIRCGVSEGEPLQAEAEYYGVEPFSVSNSPYVSLDFDNESTQALAFIYISIPDYETFPSDGNHPAREGYEWRKVSFYVEFYGIDTGDPLPDFWFLLDDYYSSASFNDGTVITPEGEDPQYIIAPVSWFGQEYEICADYYLTSEWLNDTTAIFTQYISVPEGYDGILFGITNYRYDGSILDEYNSARCALFRLD